MCKLTWAPRSKGKVYVYEAEILKSSGKEPFNTQDSQFLALSGKIAYIQAEL